MSGRSAVVDAINVYRQPARLHGLAYDQMPADILNVIKIAAGDADTTKLCIEAVKVEEAELKEAAEFYLHQMFLKAGKSRHRMLALPFSAKLETVRNHRRWLQKWLHPDRAGSKWKSAYFNQVAIAATSLEADLTNADYSDGQSTETYRKAPEVIRPRLVARKVSSKANGLAPMKRRSKPLWSRLRNASTSVKICVFGMVAMVVALPFIPDVKTEFLIALQNALGKVGY